MTDKQQQDAQPETTDERRLAVLRDAYDAEPQNPRALSNLIDHLLQMRAVQEALELCYTGIETFPHHKGIWIRCIRALKQCKEFAQMQEVAVLSHEAFPDDPILLSYLIDAHMYNGEPDQALALCEEALVRYPKDRYFYGQRVQAYFQKNDIPAAKQATETYRIQFPDEPRARAFEIELCITEGNSAKAVTFAQELLRLCKSMPLGKGKNLERAYGLQVQAYLADGQPEAAVKVAQEYHDAFPRDLYSRVLVIQAFIAAGRTNEAVVAAQEYRQDFKKEPAAHGLLVQAYLADGQTIEALAAAQEYIKRFKKEPAAYGLLVQAYLADGQTGEAVKAASLYTRQFPTESMACRLLVRAYIADRKTGQAVEAAEDYIRDCPGDPYANGFMVEAYIADRQLEKAVSAAETFKSRFPALPKAQQVAAIVSLKARDYPKAQTCIATLQEMGSPYALPLEASYEILKGNLQAGLQLYRASLVTHLNRSTLYSLKHLAQNGVGDAQEMNQFFEGIAQQGLISASLADGLRIDLTRVPKLANLNAVVDGLLTGEVDYEAYRSDPYRSLSASANLHDMSHLRPVNRRAALGRGWMKPETMRNEDAPPQCGGEGNAAENVLPDMSQSKKVEKVVVDGRVYRKRIPKKDSREPGFQL